jgi:hypothetical protein
MEIQQRRGWGDMFGIAPPHPQLLGIASSDAQYDPSCSSASRVAQGQRWQRVNERVRQRVTKARRLEREDVILIITLLCTTINFIFFNLKC